MTRKLTVLLSILLLAGLTACQQEDTVTVQLRSEYVSADAGSIFVSVGATGSWTITLDYASGPSGWAVIDPATGSGSQSNVRLRYEANGGEASRSVTVKVSPVKGATATATLTQAGLSAGRTIMGRYGYDQADGIDWLELPATKADDGRELLIHSMDGSKYLGKDRSGTRNWSCYWDFDDHLSPWVAYPHNNALKGSGSGRTDAWAFDPMLPYTLQPNLTAGSYGGGWTRGHQIPSADRLANYAVNASTFYPTNMTPQQYDFNGGIWANLEGRVRNYASMADTLYVVTGCLYEKSTQVTGNKSGFAVKVPTHYYKALLYKGANSAAKDSDGYLAAGFILPHDASIANGNPINYMVSIADLEKQTEMDFFPNLVKRLGAEKAKAIEASVNTSFWK